MLLHFTHFLYTSRRWLFVSLLLCGGLFGKAQTTITQWNFNTTNPFTIAANGTAPVPSVGTGILSLIGNVSATSATGTNQDFNSPNRALNTSDYPSLTSNPKSGGIEMTVNTTGYNGIHLKYYVQHSNTAAKKVVVQYYDGSVWQDFSSYMITTSGNFLPLTDIDLSAAAFLNNNVAAKIRLVTDFSNGVSYEPTNSTSTYGTSGTIRYDLVTITGNSMTCTGPATIQATGLRLLKTDVGSAQLTLNRGNGGGCLVVCSNAGIPSAPMNNTVYTANASFMSGTAIGNGYAVYNTQVSSPAIQYFNITNLVAGTKYYVAAYEYSAGGNCYLLPALVDSFYCNSTVLYPGDVQFIGYDNNVGGKDLFVLTNLTSLKKGTAFKIVNSRFEAGAPTDIRTNRWYAGGSSIHDNLESIELLYTATAPLDSGKIISFEFAGPTGSNIQVNGAPSGSFIITSKNVPTGFSMLSSTDPDQFFLTQGKFTAYGIPNIDQYYLLNGYVLHGVSYTNSWVNFNQNCDAGTIRQSRIPPDIEGMKLFFSTAGFAYYNSVAQHTGSQGSLLLEINNMPANWTTGSGLTTNQINLAVLNTAFTPNRLTAAGTWTGAVNNNWFDFRNWEGLLVPDSLTDVIIPTAKTALISANAPFANLYNRVAYTRALSITGTVFINGPASDKIIIYDSLLVDNTGSFSAVLGIDTIILRGNLQRQDGADLNAFTNSFLSLDGNRMLKPIDIWLITGTIYNVRTFSINNLPGVRLINGGIETVQQLELTNGVLSVTNGPAVYYLSQNCNIVSPVNLFGESNRGWEKSFIDGRVNIRTSAASPYTAPVGNAAKNIFAPVVFQPDNNDNRTYSVAYIPAANPSAPPANFATPPLDHVSELEHWTINNFFAPNSPAKITLYYTPYSRVSGAGSTAQALADLRITQYWDSISSPRQWRLYGLGARYTVTGDSSYGKISCDQYATDFSSFSENFTLGTVSPLNALPIQLISWKAMLQGNRVRLNWQVADESDVTWYTLEKSTDGVHYTGLQTVYKTSGGTNYPYISYDVKPANGWNYYRLKATGTDGKTFYSSVQKVWYASQPLWSVYPNPATDILLLQLPVAGVVTMYTIDGKMMLQRRLPASLNKLNIKSFAKGMYILEYFDGKQKLSEKIRLQ